MQPINYLLSGQSPFEALMGGMDGFQKYDNNKLVLEQNRIANQAAQDKADYLKQAQQEAQTLDYNDPNAIRQFIAKYESTGLTKGMTDYVANLDTNERQGMLADTSKAISLLRSGDGANAAQFARDKALAYKNAGMESKAAEYEQMAAMMESHPNAALQSLQMNYAVLLPKDAAGNLKDLVATYTPEGKEYNMGGSKKNVYFDKVKNEWVYDDVGDVTVTPDVLEQTSAQRYSSDNALEGQKYSSDNSRAASQYSADRNYQGTVYSSDSAKQRAELEAQSRERIAQAQRYFQKQQAEIAAGYFEPKPMNGMMYLVNKRGEYKKMLDEQGNHMTANGAIDSTTRGKVAEIQGNNDNLNQTISSLQKALQLSNQGIYDGYGANQRADFVGSIPFVNGTEESKRTQQYTNIVQGSALQQLKAIFGGMPTEGERAVLMKLQASASYPADVRAAILQEAIAAAQARIASNNRQIGTLTGQQPSYPAASAPPSSIAKPQQQGGYIGNKYK